MGKKYFPCVYVRNETVFENSQNYSYDSDNVGDDLVKNITENFNFPLLNIAQNFNEMECQLILEKALKEISKERKDEFPYSLQYRKEVTLNFWIKYYRKIYFGNLVLLFFIVVRLTK